MEISEFQDTKSSTENPEINETTSENKNTPETENTETTEKSNNWSKFGKSVGRSLLLVIVIGILGANFVYLTRINLDYFFPTDPTQRPYTDKTKLGYKLPDIFNTENKMPFNQFEGTDDSACGMPIDISKSPLLKNKYFKNMFDYGFPYTLEKKNNDTIGGILINWFLNKVKYSHIWLRSVEKTLVSFMASICEMSPNSASDSASFILGPFIIGVILLISSIWFLPALVSAFVNEDPMNPFGLWISFFGLFFGWTMIVTMCTSFVQIFTSMFTFILLPFLMGYDEIFKIMGKDWNAWWLKLIFFIFVLISAFENLDLYFSIPMLIVFIIKLIPPGIISNSKM